MVSGLVCNRLYERQISLRKHLEKGAVFGRNRLFFLAGEAEGRNRCILVLKWSLKLAALFYGWFLNFGEPRRMIHSILRFSLQHIIV